MSRASQNPAAGPRFPTTYRTAKRTAATSSRLRAMERSHQRGFTLFELMVSIMILALLVGLAVPTFRTITANSRTSAATNNLASALAVARSEALRQSTTVSICPSGNQQTCDVSVTPDWTNGWIAFTDVNADGALGAGDTLIQAWPSAGPTMTVSSA